MDRLTIRNSDGSVSQPTNMKWAEALEKLAAYEDSGYSPERVKELGQAEVEDRLVILPCELGATVYVLCSNKAAPYTVKSFAVHPGHLFLICEDPKHKGFSRICSWRETCFPTLAEAERFLEAKK